VIQAPDRTAVTSDADLVLAVRAGEPCAFDSLYARHWPRVLGVCARRVAVSDAEDVAQDVFLRALHRLDTLDDPTRFGPWVRTIAVRACADALRGRTWETVGDLPEVADATVPLIDEVVVGREDATRLAGGLATLQPRDSHALWLRDALDTPVGQIADELGLTEASTRVLLARARKRLRSAMTAVAVWLTGVVGVRRQWLTGLLPSNPAAPAMVAASAATVLAVTLLGPLATEEPATSLVPAITAPTPIHVAPAPASTTIDEASDAVAPVPETQTTDPGTSPREPDVAGPSPERAVSVERQPVDDPDPDRAAQLGDGDGGLLVDVYDGGLLTDVVDEVTRGCLGTC
jgi:RNA polymerase sigma factor (sigma-70 family)